MSIMREQGNCARRFLSWTRMFRLMKKFTLEVHDCLKSTPHCQAEIKATGINYDVLSKNFDVDNV